MEEELKCPVCKTIYSIIQEPRMLTCGHTVCIKCLQQILAKPQPSCPEDEELLDFSQIEMFPKNFSLLKLANKYQEKQNIQLKESQISNKQEAQSHSTQQPTQSTQLNDQFEKIKGERNYCMKHQKDLDIVCVTDKMLICAYCSIFGTHKDHILRPFKEVMGQIAMKVDILIEMYQMIEQAPACQEKNQEVFIQIEKELSQKQYQLEDNIKGIYHELKEVLESSQQQCLDQIYLNINLIKLELDKIKQTPNQIKQEALQ